MNGKQRKVVVASGASAGFDSQMTDEPADPDRPDNLCAPLPGDRGAHGGFDDRAHARSWQLVATMHRGWLALAGLAGFGLSLWWKSKLHGRAGRGPRP